MKGSQTIGESSNSQTAHSHFVGINHSFTWIVDFDATDHMAFDANLFFSQKETGQSD